MAAVDKAQGFVRGAMGALSDVRQRKREDEDRAFQQSELQYAQQRRGVVDQRQDLQFRQGQEDRARQQSDLQLAEQQKRAAMLRQAEQEGVRTLADSLDAGLDPAVIEQRFNASGEWKIAPGSLKYDKGTKQIAFAGPGGQQFTGTTDQLRALFGQAQEPGKPIVVSKDSRLATTGGKVLLDAVPDDPKYDEVDPTKDVYKTVNGVRTLVKKGVPKADDAGGRKTSPYNPESHAQDAVKTVRDSYRKKKDELGNFVFENPEDSERQPYAEALATRFFAEKGAEGAGFGAGEIGELAFKASKVKLTDAEAGEKAAKAGHAEGSPGYNREKARLLRDSDTKAAQVWKEGIEAIEAKREAQEQQENGGKPPLSSFQR